MRLTEVLAVLTALDRAGCSFWVEGGWGVDALAGHQTRAHRDVDVDLPAGDLDTALGVLGSLGYAVQTDQLPTRVELVAVGRGWVDLHPLVIDADGVRQADPDGGWWEFPPDCFALGALDGTPVPCCTAAAQRFFRTGYPLRDVDRHDLAVLDRLDAFGQRS